MANEVSHIWVVEQSFYNTSAPKCERYVWVKDTPSGVVVMQRGRETRISSKAMGRSIFKTEAEALERCEKVLLERAAELELIAAKFRQQAAIGTPIHEV